MTKPTAGHAEPVRDWTPGDHLLVAFVALAIGICLFALEERFAVTFAAAGVLSYTLGKRLADEEPGAGPFTRGMGVYFLVAGYALGVVAALGVMALFGWFEFGR